jgi:hypothetical protein
MSPPPLRIGARTHKSAPRIRTAAPKDEARAGRAFQHAQSGRPQTCQAPARPRRLRQWVLKSL